MIFKKAKKVAKLMIRGVFRNGLSFRIDHLVDTGTEEEINLAVQKIRQSVLTGVGRSSTLVLGIHVLDMEQVAGASVVRKGNHESPIKFR